MRILVINSGSSSMKFSLYETAEPRSQDDPRALLRGELRGIGGAHTTLEFSREGETEALVDHPEPTAASTSSAAEIVLDLVTRPHMPDFDAVGYRVVHPGAKLVGNQRITPEVFAELEQAIGFAPLHDPAVLDVIRAAMNRFPEVEHFACFDTEFHRTMPEEATVYAIPKSFRNAGVRRYGFHGLSCESVLHQLRQNLEVLPERMVIAHLGSGCSITAVKEGRSIDTSMGLTPDGGVVMGTRPGDLDPGLVLYLLRQQQSEGRQAIDAIEELLNHSSGIVALSGLENDMQVIRKAALSGDTEAVLALKVFTRCITKTIGGFAWLLGGLDAIVFTGGIGEHDTATRSESLKGLQAMHVFVDASRNEAKGNGIRRIEASDSQTSVFVIPAQEDLMIAIHVSSMARSASNQTQSS